MKVLVLDGSRGQNISSEHRKTVEEFCKELTQSVGIDCQLADIQHTALVIKDNKPGVFINTSEPIENFDLVIFRNASRFSNLAAPVCLYLMHIGTAFCNGMEGPGEYVSKIAQMFLFSIAGLPVPNTICIRNYQALEEFVKKEYSSSEHRQLIVKDNQGIRGRRNFLIDSGTSIKDLLRDANEDYLVQPFIQNDGDLRILFVGTEYPPLVFKRLASPGSHLNNTSQGGQAILIKEDDLPNGVLDTAKQAAKLYGREIAGVDILIDANGKHVVLEVNETPALASGFAKELKIGLLEHYIKTKLGVK